jgi:hypothetical protein
MTRVLLAVDRHWHGRLAQTVLWRAGIERIEVPAAAPAVVDAARRLGPRLIVVEGVTIETVDLVRRLRQDPLVRQSSVAVIADAPTRAETEELRQAGANVVLSGADQPAQWDDPFETLLGIPPRIDLRVPVTVTVSSRRAKEDAVTITGHAVNLSLKGLLLESAEPVTPGAIFNLSFRLPSSAEDLRLVGRAVWVAPCSGGATRCGVKFLGFHGHAMERIQAFVDSTGPTGP